MEHFQLVSLVFSIGVDDLATVSKGPHHEHIGAQRGSKLHIHNIHILPSGGLHLLATLIVNKAYDCAMGAGAWVLKKAGGVFLERTFQYLQHLALSNRTRE